MAADPNRKPLLQLRFEGPGKRPKTVWIDLVPDGRWDDAQRLRWVAGAPPPRLPPASRYTIWVRQLDGWTSDQSREDDVPVSEDGTIAMLVRLPGRVELLVVDGLTNQPLAGATVLPMVGHETYVEDSPAPTKETRSRALPLRCDRDGLVLLPATTRRRSWWVHAAGHRWTRAVTSPETPRTRCALPVGGGIHANVVTSTDLDPYEVFAIAESEVTQYGRSAEWQAGAWMRQDDALAVHTVDGLAPGRWRVVLGPRGDFTVREAWVAAEVDVVAGRITELTLVVPPRVRTPRHTLSGSIRVPPDWTDKTTHICVSGMSGATRSITQFVDLEGKDLREGLPFTVDDLVPGLYRVAVYPQEWTRSVWIPDESRGLRLDVPAPREIRVRVVDATSDQTIHSADVAVYTPFLPSPLHRAQAAKAPDEDEPDEPGDLPARYEDGGYLGTFRRRPRGPHIAQIPANTTVIVEASAAGYVDTQMTVESAGLRNPQTIVVRLQHESPAGTTKRSGRDDAR